MSIEFEPEAARAAKVTPEPSPRKGFAAPARRAHKGNRAEDIGKSTVLLAGEVAVALQSDMPVIDADDAVEDISGVATGERKTAGGFIFKEVTV